MYNQHYKGHVSITFECVWLHTDAELKPCTELLASSRFFKLLTSLFCPKGTITLQERCCHSRVLHVTSRCFVYFVVNNVVTSQRRPEIAYICAGCFVYFVVNKMSYFSVYGPGLILTFACTDSYYAYKMTRMCSKPVSFVVSVPQIAPFSMQIKN